MQKTSRRTLLACLATAPVLSRPARAATKVTFLTSWYAQAEHGGYYQAKGSCPWTWCSKVGPRFGSGLIRRLSLAA
jgi:hypothetical protein